MLKLLSKYIINLYQTDKERMYKLTFVLLVLTILLLSNSVNSSQYTPIAKKIPGISISNRQADIQIDLIYDPQCNDLIYDFR